MGRTLGLLGVGLWVFLLLPVAAARGQGDSTQQQRFLEARRKQIELRQAREALHQTQELDAAGLASATDLRGAMAAHEKAQLTYQEALLDLMGSQPRISIREASRFQGSFGEPFVRLTLVNMTSILYGAELELLESFDEAVRLPADLRSGTVRSVSVSLRDTGAVSAGNAEPIRGATVALPFENLIEELAYGKAKTVTFQLLRDVTTVTVHLEWSGGTQATDIHLQQAKGDKPLRMLSVQRSLEADLGSTATFDLRLVRPAVDIASYRLRAINLPRQIGALFLDPGTNARLNQASFAAGVTEQAVQLRLFLPDDADDQLPLDETLRFWALAGNDEEVAEVSALPSVSEQDLSERQVGFVGLEITPRGIGRLEISTVSLFSEMRLDDVLEVKLQVENSGSRGIDNVRLVVEPPLGWQADATPALIETLAPQESHAVILRIQAAGSAAVGVYEVRLKAESTAFDQQVPSQEKLYRISLEGRQSIVASGVLLFLIVAVSTVLVIFGIRLTRR